MTTEHERPLKIIDRGNRCLVVYEDMPSLIIGSANDGPNGEDAMRLRRFVLCYNFCLGASDTALRLHQCGALELAEENARLRRRLEAYQEAKK